MSESAWLASYYLGREEHVFDIFNHDNSESWIPNQKARAATKKKEDKLQKKRAQTKKQSIDRFVRLFYLNYLSPSLSSFSLSSLNN